MRPLYETAADREREKMIATAVANVCHMVACKLPDLYQLDFCLVKNGSVKRLLECKWRDQKYDTMIIGLHKWTAYMNFASRAHLPLLVAWAIEGQGIYMRRFEWFENPPFAVGFNGRTDRGDDQDREPCVHIPFVSFSPLSVESLSTSPAVSASLSGVAE